MQDSAERLVIEVHDTGIGMSPEGLSRIFKDFAQSEQDTTQKYGGTGLGLALTKRFCTLMGGTIAVSSQPGQGSTFVIDIPYKGADDDLATAPKAAIRMIEASAA
jgi:signal transduction histidine kinase